MMDDWLKALLAHYDLAACSECGGPAIENDVVHICLVCGRHVAIEIGDWSEQGRIVALNRRGEDTEAAGEIDDGTDFN
jgi:uncharacterized Zn finger protein (UPF0148 family)